MLSMIGQRICLHIWIHISERKEIRSNQPLNFIFQSYAMLKIMARCSLMIRALDLSFVPPWKFLRYWWWCSSLNETLFNQSRVQFCVSHWNRIKLWSSLHTILIIVKLLNLWSRLLLLKLRSKPRIRCCVNNWRNSSYLSWTTDISFWPPLGYHVNTLFFLLWETTSKLFGSA